MRSDSEVKAAIAKVRLFSALDDGERHTLASHARLRRCAKGGVLIEQGDSSDAIFGIVTGRLKVSLLRGDGSEATLALLGAGDMFGELGLFTDGGRSAQITALESGQVLSIGYPAFRAALSRSPALGFALSEALATRVREMAVQLEETTTVPMHQRLARRIVVLVERWGVSEKNGLSVGIRLSQQDLAELADTSRQSVNKHLSLWKREGVIVAGPGRLIVRDLNRLKRIAAGRD